MLKFWLLRDRSVPKRKVLVKTLCNYTYIYNEDGRILGDILHPTAFSPTGGIYWYKQEGYIDLKSALQAALNNLNAEQVT